jgi:hypothetical protein
MVLHTYNPITSEGKTGGSWVQGQPGLYSELKATLGYIVTLTQQDKNIQTIVEADDYPQYH